MELNELRNQIDVLDRQLTELFAKRLDICKKIAEYKRENGIEVYDEKREAAVLEKIAALCEGEFVEPTVELYKAIFSISRDFQTKNINENYPNSEEDV